MLCVSITLCSPTVFFVVCNFQTFGFSLKMPEISAGQFDDAEDDIVEGIELEYVVFKAQLLYNMCLEGSRPISCKRIA